MTTVKWRKYKSWSGCKISGGAEYIPADLNDHMQRALWLTAQVEGGGAFGAINSYDGAGISAGLEHKIAVYPKNNEQGSLWKVLRKLELYAPNSDLEVLWDAFKADSWYLDQAGVLRYRKTGTRVPGRRIRNTIAPPAGKVPKSGPDWETAKRWATLFHNLFKNPTTHQVQIDSAIESLVKGNRGARKVESEAYQVTVGVEHPTVLRYGTNIDSAHDLAWCVYHSFSVNAPSMARKQLIASRPTSSSRWPKKLIRVLGTTNYGRWHDTNRGGGNRYDRTRKYAKRSGFWPAELFDGSNTIMPQNL